MADTMQFDLVSPERRLASMEAREVQIPGAEGDMTAMPDHEPTITTLRPGLVRATGSEGTVEFLVTGGFAEITATSASVLAEVAVPRAEVTAEMMAEFVAQAEKAAADANAETKDVANKAAAEMAAIAQELR